MHRSLAAVLVVLGLTVPVLSAPAADADPTSPGPVPLARQADGALARAGQALAGEGSTRQPSPTLALRDLFAALPSLDTAERRQARAMLGRPTQGPNDPYDDGYTVPSKRTCSPRICLHWVNRTADAPPGRAWVDRSLAVMKRVWAREVGDLGYRRPVTDGDRGGDQRFDVYLKDVGSEGYYGYCAPERRRPGHKWQASGYCVLDDDFARSQFGARPIESLRVTAAHEFFHAVQFAYDYGEDRWLMEASATWMEERVADGVNDNRQYLAHGQVSRPAVALDYFDPQGFSQYGNWVFFEYLSKRFGIDVVRRVWAGAAGSWRNYSTLAVRRVLPDGLGWAELFRAYTAANTTPGRSYAEGKAWPRPSTSGTHTLGPANPTVSSTLRVDHMASRVVVLKPGDDLRGNRWSARVRVDGPGGRRATAYVLVHKTTGNLARKPVDLDDLGAGQRVFRFNAGTVSRAVLVLGNASTRFDCWEQETTYSCQGIPRDDDRQFSYDAEVLER